MKKTCISFIIVLIFLLLTGCNSNNDTHTVKNGTYIMEQEETDVNLLPYVTISDDKISFSYDSLSSYWPLGSYSIDDDKLTMTTDDNMYIYVFQIDGDNLIFQKNDSSSVKLIDDRLGVKITDNVKFHLKDD